MDNKYGLWCDTDQRLTGAPVPQATEISLNIKIFRSFAGTSAITVPLLLSCTAAKAEVDQSGVGEFQRRLNICIASEEWLQRACLETLRSFNPRDKSGASPTDTGEVSLPSYDEMHLIGIYEPTEHKSSSGSVLRGEVVINVDRPGRSVALVMGSYDPVRWIVNTSPDTTVTRIIIGGHGAKRSEAVLNGQATSAEIKNLPIAYEIEGDRFQPFHSAAAKITGVARADSFSGSYTAPKEGFTISAAPGIATMDEVEKELLKEARNPATLSPQMQAVLTGGVRAVATNWKLTPKGFTGIDANGVPVQYDMPLDLPEVSWPMGVAYDPEHQRVWGVTLGGEGYLYEYDIALDQWLAWSMRNFDAGGLIFDSATGRLVATPGPWHGEYFLVMDRQAKVISKVHIPLVEYPGLTDTYDRGNDPNPAMLPLAIEGNLLLVQALHRIRGTQVDAPPLNYLVDMERQTVELVR